MQSSGITEFVLLGDKFPDLTGLLAEMTENTASRESIEPLIIELKDRWYRRNQISVMNQAITTLSSDFDSTAFKQAEKTISDLSLTDNIPNKPESIGEVMPKMFHQFKTVCTGEGIKTSLIDLDNIFGVFMPGEYTILAARPSMGKTALALQIARIASRRGFPVLIFSLETSKNMICGRITFGAAQKSLERALSGDIKEIAAAQDATLQMCDLPIYIDTPSEPSSAHIKSVSEYYYKKFEIGLIIIDHIGLIGVKHGRTRNEEVSVLSKSIKRTSLKLNIPTIALCQLSRACEGRKPSIPILSDLRDSGTIEEDADKVLFIYREEQYIRDSNRKGIAELILAKNKNGKTGYVECCFEKETMTFRDLVKDENYYKNKEKKNRSEF